MLGDGLLPQRHREACPCQLLAGLIDIRSGTQALGLNLVCPAQGCLRQIQECPLLRQGLLIMGELELLLRDLGPGLGQSGLQVLRVHAGK